MNFGGFPKYLGAVCQSRYFFKGPMPVVAVVSCRARKASPWLEAAGRSACV